MERWLLPDWKEVEPFAFAESRKAFTGPESPDRILPVRYFKRGDGRLVALARFTDRVEGAPGRAHGGAILTVLDEALGAAAWLAGHPVFTVRLSAEFRKPVPIPSELLVITELLSVRRRIVRARGELKGPDGARYARAEGEYIKLDKETTRRLKA